MKPFYGLKMEIIFYSRSIRGRPATNVASEHLFGFCRE
jgi:hypothetical protein